MPRGYEKAGPPQAPLPGQGPGRVLYHFRGLISRVVNEDHPVVHPRQRLLEPALQLAPKTPKRAEAPKSPSSATTPLG